MINLSRHVVAKCQSLRFPIYCRLRCASSKVRADDGGHQWSAASLNDHLATRSYIDGCWPTDADVKVLDEVALWSGKALASRADKYPHAARWAGHIAFLKTVGRELPTAKVRLPVIGSHPIGKVAHGFRDEALVRKLASLGVAVIADPVGFLTPAGRPQGHSTHNFFVHDKKNKARRMLVTVRQASMIDMKALATILGYKSLRLCPESESLLGSAKGCITALSLAYDEDARVQWVVEEALLASASWRLGVSRDGQVPASVTDVPLSALEALLKPTGHWEARRVVAVPG